MQRPPPSAVRAVDLFRPQTAQQALHHRRLPRLRRPMQRRPALAAAGADGGPPPQQHIHHLQCIYSQGARSWSPNLQRHQTNALMRLSNTIFLAVPQTDQRHIHMV